jgi:hypothetical protein
MPHDYKLINKLFFNLWKELKQALLSCSKQQPIKALILSIFVWNSKNNIRQ